MGSPGVRWKFGHLLEREGVTVYALNKDLAEHQQSVSRTTLYRLANEQPERIDLEVTARILAGLERLTGKHYEVWDLLERTSGDAGDEQEALLRSDVADVGEAIEELEREVPPEEHEAWLRSFGLGR